MSRIKDHYSVVFVFRPAEWMPRKRLDCPPLPSLLGIMLPAVKPKLAKAAARAYNRNPEPGRWAVLKASLSQQRPPRL